MKVSPGEVYDLYKEGLPVSEIARKLNISRALVNLKLREYELDEREHALDEREHGLDEREHELDNRKREVDFDEDELAARKKEIDKLPDLEEKAHSLKSTVDSLTKKIEEQEGEIKSNRKVLEKIKDFEERREEATNQLSELSDRLDTQKKSLKKLEETQKQTQKQIETESITLQRIKHEVVKNRKENSRLVDENKHLEKENKHLEEETRVKKKAIKEIERYYYGFVQITKEIALFIPGRLDTQTKTHEEIREKFLLGMEKIAEEAKITKEPKTTKPDRESDLQALLRDPTILKDFTFEHHPSKPSRSRTLRGVLPPKNF